MPSMRSLPNMKASAAPPTRRLGWWIAFGLIIAFLVFVGWKSCVRNDDPVASATKTVMNRDAVAEKKAPSEPAKAAKPEKGSAYCAAHADDEDVFASWYCTEFAPWAKKVDARESTPNNTKLWVVIGALVLLQIFTWVALARKKDKEP